MARPRTPGSTTLKRAQETAAWRKQWETARADHRPQQERAWKSLASGKCEGYLYLLKISTQLGPGFALFEEALAALQVLGLDGPEWRRNLDSATRRGSGSAQDNFAFGIMRHLLIDLKWKNELRVAEFAVAHLGLYPEAANWQSAVTRCREVVRQAKAQKFQALGAVVEVDGLYVRVRKDNLRGMRKNSKENASKEVRRIIDPYDMKPIPPAGKRVADNAYWRNLAKRGLIEIVQDE